MWKLPVPILAALVLVAASDLPRRLTFGQVTLAAVLTALALVASLVVMPKVLATPGGSLRPVWPLWLFVGWTIVMAALRGLTIDGMQNLTVFLLFAAVTATTIVYGRAHAPTIYRWMLRIGWWLAGLYGISVALYGANNEAILQSRTFGLQALIFMALTVPLPKTTHWERALPWVLFILIAASTSRTSLVIAGAFIVLRAAHSGGTRRNIRRSVGAAALGTLALGWAIFNVPVLSERFFEGDRGLTVGGVTINASGRTNIWNDLTEDIHGVHLLGFGPGRATAKVRSSLVTIDQPHNDYLRVFYDYGLVGAVLFIWALARLLRSVVARALRTRDLHAAAPHSIAVLALAAVMLTMLTDNALIYSWAMAPVGVLIGLSLSHDRREIGHSGPHLSLRRRKRLGWVDI